MKREIEFLRKENENLKMKLANLTSNIENNNFIGGDKFITLNFISVDQRIKHTITCKNEMKFYIVEDQLYEQYPEYINGENFFMYNGYKINRWKTLKDNGIKENSLIVLQKIE